MKRNAPRLVACLLVLLASPALAAAPADNSNATERARAVFHQGVQLYNEGSFEAALAEFRKAYQLSPSYRLLFNIAQTYFDLHDYVSSYAALQQYVWQGGGEITAARRAEVIDLSQKLEERIAHLEIACSVDGADIRVDDISVGLSPLEGAIPVNAGPRRITAVKLGYAVAARMVTVVGREHAKVLMDMSQPMRAQAVAGGGTSTTGFSEGMPHAFLRDEPAHVSPPRVGLITSSVVAGGLAVATGVFAAVAWQAKNDFNTQLGKIPNTKDNVDSARTKMTNYAHVTDALGAATAVSAGVVLYFLLTDTGSKKPPSTKRSVALVPTMGGMLLHGEW